MRKRKIVYIIEAAEGGTLTYLDMLLMNIDLKAFEPTVIISFRRSNLAVVKAEVWKRKGVQVIQITSLYRAINIIFDFASFLKIYRILKRKKYDILQAISSKAGFIGGWAGWLANIPKRVYSPHGLAHLSVRSYIGKQLYLWLDYLTVQAFNYVVAISQTEKKMILDLGICKTDRIRQIENTVDSKVFSLRARSMRKIGNWNVGKDQKVIGWVGRFVLQKNPWGFIQLAAHLSRRSKEIYFAMVGTGKQVSFVKREVIRLGLDYRFIFLGQQNNMPEIYRTFNILVNTSWWEGMPYAILEALACGIYVFAHDIPGNREIITPGQNGELISLRELDRTSDQIIKKLSYNHKKSLITKRNKSNANQKDSIENWVQKHERLYLGD